jgi:5-methylcytosine-specific restriction endonuclease McrA
MTNPRATRAEVLERDHFECQLRYDGCVWSATEVHHVHTVADRAVRRADTGDPDDAVAACKPCRDKVIARQRQASQAQINAMRAARKRGVTP